MAETYQTKFALTADGVVRVGSASPPHDVAGALFRAIMEQQQWPVMRAIGHGAVGQACKAIAIARSYTASRGLDLACTIGFDNITMPDGKEVVAQTFRFFFR